MDLRDPSYLCALALTFNDDNTYDRRHATSRSSGGGEPTDNLAPILDALARVVVCQPREEVVAIGCLIDKEEHGIQLHIAANPTGVSARMANHLDAICASLLNVRATLADFPTSKYDFLVNEIRTAPHRAPSDEPVFNSLRALELDLFKYSGKRMISRYKKQQRHANFSYVLTCISTALSDTTLQDLSEQEKVALKRLQDSGNIKRSLPHLNEAINLLSKFAAPEFLWGGLDNADVECLRKGCIRLASAASILQDDMTSFDILIIEHLRRKMDTPPKKFPSTLKWLKKASYVATEFKQLTKILTDPALSATFGTHVPILPIPDTTSFNSPRIEQLTVSNITEALVYLKYTEKDFSHYRTDDGLTLVQDVIKKANKSRDTTKRLHCECAVLCRLGQEPTREDAHRYIGVSKLSCTFCELYFAAYCAINIGKSEGGSFHTRGTHGQPTAAWMWPSAPGDAAIKESFCDMLLEYIKERLEAMKKSKRVSFHSQSTAASDDSNADDVIQRWNDLTNDL